MALGGLWVLLFPIIFPSETKSQEQGTALLLVAAGILFAGVFITWDWRKNRLAAFASFWTSVFGFLGTSYILAGENPLLLMLLGLVTFYSVGIGILLAFMITYITKSISLRISKTAKQRLSLHPTLPETADPQSPPAPRPD